MLILGIDPDVEKNGVALWNTLTEKFELIDGLTFWDLTAFIQRINPDFIIIEAGWLIKKHNWHGSKNKSTSERISNNVGRNHQIGRLLEDFCKTFGFSCQLQKPKGKITAADFEKLTGTKIKNQDLIDAAMLVYKINIKSLKLGA